MFPNGSVWRTNRANSVQPRFWAALSPFGSFDKLQFWDWGTEGKSALVLVHVGLDHARNWDAVARALRDDYHVYALDLRGPGNSEWAPGIPSPSMCSISPLSST